MRTFYMCNNSKSMFEALVSIGDQSLIYGIGVNNQGYTLRAEGLQFELPSSHEKCAHLLKLFYF